MRMPKSLIGVFIVSAIGCGTTSNPSTKRDDPATKTVIQEGASSAEGCAAASLTLPSDTIVATINGTPLLAGDIKDLASSEAAFLKTYCSEVDSNRRSLIDAAIREHLIEKAAAKANQTRAQWLQSLTQTEPPTDAEVREYYDRRKSADTPPFDEIKSVVLEAMTNERNYRRIDQVVTAMVAENAVEVALPDVRPPPTEIAVTDSTAASGDVDAKVTVVEFSDFECPFCAKAATELSILKSKYGSRVRFIFKHFPLSFHKRAMPAARVAQCAHRQGKFWPIHDAFFSSGALDEKAMKSQIVAAGLDVEKIESCLSDPTIDKEIQADMEEGARIGVRGTPTIFINGRHHKDNFDAATLSDVIDAELRLGQ